MARGLSEDNKCNGINPGDFVPTPLYGGEGRLTTGVLRLDAENCLGDTTGGPPVIASMDNGDGLGFGPDRDLIKGHAVFVSLLGGGVRGVVGIIGDPIGDLSRFISSSRRRSAASSSRRLREASSETKCRGTSGASDESSDGGEGDSGGISGDQ